MAWNEPGNGGDNKGRNPWGSGEGSDGRDKDSQRPPSPWGDNGDRSKKKSGQSVDVDEALKKLQDGISGFFKKGKSGKGGGPEQGGGSSTPRNPLLLPAGLVGVALLVWAGSGFYLVDQSERAVVLRLGQYHATVEPGLHWHAPLIDKLDKVNVSAVRSFDQQSSMLTADTNIVKVNISVQYQVDKPRDYVLNVRDPEASLRDALDSTLRHVVGASGMQNVLTSTAEVKEVQEASEASSAKGKSPENAEDAPIISMTPPVKNSLLSGREQLGPIVAERLQQTLDRYGVGLRLQAVNLESTAAPDEIQDAVDDVIRSREDRQRDINQAHAYENALKPRTDGEAQRTIEQAYGYRDAVVADAQGETQRFLSMLGGYRSAPDLTRTRIYLDTLSGIYSSNPKAFVDVDRGNQSLIYLPIDQLRKQHQADTASSADDNSSNDSNSDNGDARDSQSNASSGSGSSARSQRSTERGAR
ncbi:protease modulator HflK [Carnimonas bestiolae]|uniref:protease modulator HflK n=1 Tax=Carnimonas bestiolae TaxID=3402172 RepID=UPI003EDBC0BA